MIIVIILVGLCIFGLMIGVAVGGLGKSAATTRERAIADADTTWADLFDGRKTTVYVSHDAAIPTDMVTEAADRHGYDVVSVEPGGAGFNAQTITMTRREDAPPPPPKPTHSTHTTAQGASSMNDWTAKNAAIAFGTVGFFVALFMVLASMD